MQVHRPLSVGVPALREDVIRDVVMKPGKSGALAFVTVAYHFVQESVPCPDEEQDTVYREAGAPVAAPQPADLPPPPDGSRSRTLQPDPRLLFRFSALTFKAHRIHCDRADAVDVEGYPGLVVHGPLTAVLLQLVRHATPQPVRAFNFRGVAPLFDLGPLRLLDTPGPDSVALEAQGPDGRAALLATAALA